MPRRPHIVFVNMPFANLDGPALGLSILKSILEEAECKVDIVYLNIIFAEVLGWDIYRDHFRYDTKSPETNDYIPFDALAGEWAFSQNYYGDDSARADDYLNQVLKQAPWKLSARALDAVIKIKNRVPRFLEESLGRVDWGQYDVVGFTTTFEQTMPSLYLARALKERHSRLKIIFGGANCEGEMGVELLRQYDFIDCVCLGEGEPIIRQIVEGITEGTSLEGVPNVAYRDQHGAVKRGGGAAGSFDFAESPAPNFDDYFEQLRSSKLSGKVRPWIHMEASRGCWWGMKQHCTFCGLNGTNMSFRSKKATRVLDEMMHYHSRYEVTDFAFVDNILDMSYFESLLPALAAGPRKFRIWFEVKSNLRREHIRQLSEAGLSDVQPGIESFSTSILAEMKKGVTGIQNVAFLKWARQFGVNAWWNILYGFPKEDEREYLLQVETLKRIVHLQLPSTICKIRIDRFSPNYNRATEMGFKNVRPLRPYGFVFPFAEDVLSRLCYFFDYDYADGRDPHAYTKPLRRFWLQWLHHPQPGDLRITALPDGGAVIRDTRFTRKHSKYRLTPVQHYIYQCCDGPTKVSKLMRQLREKFTERSFEEEVVCNFLAYMETNYLMMEEGGRFLSLALPIDGEELA